MCVSNVLISEEAALSVRMGLLFFNGRVVMADTPQGKRLRQ